MKLVILTTLVAMFLFSAPLPTMAAQKIYFTVCRDIVNTPKEYHVMSIELDGKNLKDLKIPVTIASSIVPAPDKSGKFIATLVAPDSKTKEYSIRIYDESGKEIQRILRLQDTGGDLESCIDPLCSWLNGNEILYSTTCVDHLQTIWRISVSSGKREPVLRTYIQFNHLNPIVSPDGKKLAFTYYMYKTGLSDDELTKMIFHYYIATVPMQPAKLLDLSSLETATTLPNPVKVIADIEAVYFDLHRFLCWSADSKRLGFFAPKRISGLYDDEFDTKIVKMLSDPMLYVYDFTEKRLYKQAPTEKMDTCIIDAVLSPDGKKFVFATLTGIWLWNVGETKVTRLVDAFEPREPEVSFFGDVSVPKFFGPITRLDWLPDSKTIVFNTGCQLFVMDIGKEPKQIFQDPKLRIRCTTIVPQ